MISLLITLLTLAVSLIAAAHALLTKRDSKSALGWVAACLFFPIAGAIFYLIFGINRVESKAKEIYASEPMPQENLVAQPSHKSCLPYSLIGQSIGAGELKTCSDLRLLESGEGAYPAMLEAIDDAKKCIYLSTYIFHNDDTGKNFVKHLENAMNRGIDVRVLVDGLGGTLYGHSIEGSLKAAKISYRFFDPLTLFPPSLHLNMRNHRKLLVVDHEIAFTGGQNIGDRHLANFINNHKRTLDLHFRLTGEIVTDLERAFLKDWLSCESKPAPKSIPATHSNPDEELAFTRVVLDGPNENLDKLNELLVGLFALAKDRIWIMTPYFLPGLDLVGALLGAKHRGVDVKIIVPNRSNVYITHWATQHSLQYIEAKGLGILLQPEPFVHTKAILIDDVYSLIGSANLDPRSLRLNFEIAVEVFDKTFNTQLSHYFDTRIKLCSKMAQQDLPFFIRIRNALAWLFTPYL